MAERHPKIVPPPIVRPPKFVLLKGKNVSIAELRKRFPNLHKLISETSFQDGDQVFPTQEEACLYSFREAGENLSEEVRILNEEIVTFRREFPDDPDRTIAFVVLGSIISGPSYINLRLTPISLERLRR